MERRAQLSFEPFAAVEVMAFENDAGWEGGDHCETLARGD
jgi:hypothetical protein